MMNNNYDYQDIFDDEENDGNDGSLMKLRQTLVSLALTDGSSAPPLVCLTLMVMIMMIMISIMVMIMIMIMIMIMMIMIIWIDR